MDTARQTPVSQPNGVYCSPRCGFKCTRAAFNQAHEEAAALCKELGEGWEPRIWENWGWNYEAVSIHMRVTPDLKYPCSGIVGGWRIKGWTCWVNTQITPIQVIEARPTPREAVQAAKANAERQISQSLTMLKEMK